MTEATFLANMAGMRRRVCQAIVVWRALRCDTVVPRTCVQRLSTQWIEARRLVRDEWLTVATPFELAEWHDELRVLVGDLQALVLEAVAHVREVTA